MTAASQSEFEVTAAFPTLIGRCQRTGVEAINERLARQILDRERSSPSHDHANFGGWHSAADLLDWQGDEIVALRNWITGSLQQIVRASLLLPESQGRQAAPRGSFAVSAWANVSRRGNYHRLHNHPGSVWSGCYYVTGQPDDQTGSLAGVLEIYDPRPFTEMVDCPGSPYGQRILIRPTPGLLIFFPSWLYHFVHPCDSDDPRISIAFNASWRPS
jgi:uncharacterized protein (TIGR02466 family)